MKGLQNRNSKLLVDHTTTPEKAGCGCGYTPRYTRPTIPPPPHPTTIQNHDWSVIAATVVWLRSHVSPSRTPRQFF